MQVTTVLKQKTFYEVIIDEKTLKLDPSVYLKYHLKVGQEIDKKTFQMMINDQHYVTYDHLALKKLKQMQTVYELKTYLKEKGAPLGVIKQLIDRYIKHKYLDDLNYAKTFLLMKSQSKGPKMMIENLKTKGISDDIIKEVFKDYNESEVLDKLMLKKVAKTKGKSKNQLKTLLYTHFLSKGFTAEIIQSQLSKALMTYDEDEDQLIEKTYQLAFHKYQQTYPLYEASQKALQKCIQKGFKYHDIKRVILNLDQAS